MRLRLLTGWSALRILFAVLAFLVLAVSACGEQLSPIPLDTLVLQDSLYLHAETLEPYTGPVLRMFADDPGQVQLRGELADGTWNGELVVYHQSGRVRYMGSLSNGAKCGEWVENRDDEPPEDILAELKQEIESLGMYPPCSR